SLRLRSLRLNKLRIRDTSEPEMLDSDSGPAESLANRPGRLKAARSAAGRKASRLRRGADPAGQEIPFGSPPGDIPPASAIRRGPRAGPHDPPGGRRTAPSIPQARPRQCAGA